MDITNFEVKCESCEEIVNPEGPKNGRKYGLLVAAISAIFFGLGVGGTIGIATAGLGIAATIPLGLLGAYFGFKGGRWVASKQDGVTCPACESLFS